MRLRISWTSGSPWRMAAVAPAWIGPAVPLLMYCVMAPSWSATPDGCVSQPMRQPVIAQAFEKLFTASTRSPSSAICRVRAFASATSRRPAT